LEWRTGRREVLIAAEIQQLKSPGIVRGFFVPQTTQISTCSPSRCARCPLERVAFFPGVQASIRLTTADFLRADSELESWTRALNVVFDRQH
jgi:hypothetical protein